MFAVWKEQKDIYGHVSFFHQRFLGKGNPSLEPTLASSPYLKQHSTSELITKKHKIE